MKRMAKSALVRSLKLAKKAANSNPHTKRAAQKTRHTILRVLSSNQQEVYNVASFYPSIADYYKQQHTSFGKSAPCISVLLPTYNTPETFLRECIESIIVQSYPNWELCIADDNSSDPRVVEIIEEYTKTDSRIKLVRRTTNGHISIATNSALEVATGDYVALMDHDDVLWPNALYEMARAITEDTDVDLIYSDEDKIDGSGTLHSYPFLKPDYSPEFLESCNYITHFSCIKMSLMRELKGLRAGYEGAQDWDLFIRIGEKTDRIVHIPKLLYSWRIHEASTASDTDAKPYVYEAQKKLLEDHIQRIGKKGTVETGIITQHRTIKYEVDQSKRVAVVVSGSDQQKLAQCLRALRATEAGVSYELYVMSKHALGTEAQVSLRNIYHGSMDFIQLPPQKTVLTEAASSIAADYFIFVDQSVRCDTSDWAARLLGDCQLDGVGFVGGVLLNQDGDTVYSAGLGIGYCDGRYADMLQGMPFTDMHYTRGLYVKSRRNVSAVNPALYAVSAYTLQTNAKTIESASSVIDVAIRLLGQGLRHVYTPYCRATAMTELPTEVFVPPISLGEDRYLNPNFNHNNARMEVRS